MVLYHGSTYDFMEIDLSKARKGKDFGLGYEWLIQHLKYYRIILNVIILGR